MYESTTYHDGQANEGNVSSAEEGDDEMERGGEREEERKDETAT